MRGLLLPGILFGPILLLSCAHHPLSPLPETFTFYEETTPVPDRWWRSFESAELDTLVDNTLAGSLTLDQSLARLEQSQALVVQAGADTLPGLSLNAGASETRRETGGQRIDSSSRSLTLASSWELDFWGRIKATKRAALLEQESSKENLYSTAITPGIRSDS